MNITNQEKNELLYLKNYENGYISVHIINNMIMNIWYESGQN